MIAILRMISTSSRVPGILLTGSQRFRSSRLVIKKTVKTIWYFFSDGLFFFFFFIRATAKCTFFSLCIFKTIVHRPTLNSVHSHTYQSLAWQTAIDTANPRGEFPVLKKRSQKGKQNVHRLKICVKFFL